MKTDNSINPCSSVFGRKVKKFFAHENAIMLRLRPQTHQFT